MRASGIRRSGIRTRTLALSAVPLGFLIALLAISLFLQQRNAAEAEQSRRLSMLLSTADQGTDLLDKASRSVLAFDKSRQESELRGYDQVRRDLPATLAALAQLQRGIPAGRPAEQRLSRALTRGFGVLTQYLAYSRAADGASKTRLATAPGTSALSVEISTARADFTTTQRRLTLDQLRVVRRQIAVLTFVVIGLSLLGIALTLYLALRFGMRITNRIMQLAENARRLARGEEAQHIDGNDEISELDAVYREMMARTKREHDVVTTLQRALLPDRLPIVPGVRLDACYVPAFSGADVGGDWYDVFSITDRLLGVSVGDVTGHGMRAATIMGQARQALRTASYVDSDPGVVLSFVNRLFCRWESNALITAFVATLDLVNGTLRYALAGHPPPMSIRTGGEVESLPGSGFVLGLEPRATFKTHSVRLDEGSAIVLFTDGLVEVNRNFLEGMRQLSDAIEHEYREASHNIAQAIVKRVVDGRSPRDDVALLFLGITALGAAAFPPQRMQWTTDARSERSARRVKRALLWQLGEMTEGSADLAAAELVINELLANVARHTPGPAEVALEWHNERATIFVSDRGRAFMPPDGTAKIDLFAESGRGLFLVSAVATDLHVERMASGNRVSAVLPLRVVQPA
jgi:serine phosphatase RsbU (regulator of sigma subunit)/anti-sigma regulatory factor (Ser/Thr protein kinase)